MVTIYTAHLENGYAEFLTLEEAQLYSENITTSERDLEQPTNEGE
jgi:hypothetical protein